uniref:SOSS complex subunit A homolog n=1 Tax=Steinernema glaseri TaxID=37863 RepID=A0A1I7YYC2_9BILA
MDDMDGSLMIDTKESSSSSSEEVGILERYTAALSDDNLRELTNELDEAVRNNDGSAVEIFNKLLYAVCEKIASAEDEQLELVAHCLLVIFQPFFSKHQFVPKDTSDDSVSETLSNTPFYALFRILSLMSDEERGNHKLLVLLVQMHEKKPCLSYLMLYFLKGGRTADDGGGMNIDDDSVRLYSSFCKQREESVEDQLALDLETCETDDHRLFVYLVPYIFDKFDTHVIGSPAVLKVVCSHVDRTQLLALTCSVFRETITMFRRDSFPQLIVASLEWEPLDQLTLWRFIHSDNIPADWIFPVIPKLSSSKHPEAVANALLMLRRMSRDPTMNLIKMMFSKPAKDTFTVNALMIIFDEDDAIHRTATLLLNLVKRLTKSGSLLISKNQKGALCVELVIAHIENLRQAYLAKGTKKVETFFSHADLREMFVEIKNEHSLEQIPKKYTELFTTVEIMEDERKGRGGRKTARRRAAVTNNNGDSDSDVPAVKKKRRVKEESDSD